MLLARLIAPPTIDVSAEPALPTTPPTLTPPLLELDADDPSVPNPLPPVTMYDIEV
jgi:hypothetical protein